GQSFEAASASPFYALATWNPEALRGDPTFDMFADALDTGHYREVPRPDSPEESQIHDFISGWLALVYDDPLTARRLLSRRGPSDLVGLWQSAFLARAHSVLGEFQEASAV